MQGLLDGEKRHLSVIFSKETELNKLMVQTNAANDKEIKASTKLQQFVDKEISSQPHLESLLKSQKQ